MKCRLALYSDQEIAANATVNRRLLTLIGVDYPRIGYISSAPDPARHYFSHKQSYYHALGCELSVYVDSAMFAQPGLLSTLFDCDAIHLTGGNTYFFLRWLQESGMIQRLRSYSTSGGVLIGASAGSLLMTKSIAIAELSGDTPDPSMTTLEALGLVDFHFWPHYRPGAESQPNESAFLSKVDFVYACPDGAAVIVDGPRVELIGGVKAFRNGQIDA